jgi:hypothetical protein
MNTNNTHEPDAPDAPVAPDAVEVPKVIKVPKVLAEVEVPVATPAVLDIPTEPQASMPPDKFDLPAPAPDAFVKRAGVIVAGGETDPVYLDKCVFKNTGARKSLSVHHLQRRLVELGYHNALGDPDGWYGDDTRACVHAFQKDSNIDGDGIMDATTLEALFARDPHVTVVLVN